jgi:hypothetical protein
MHDYTPCNTSPKTHFSTPSITSQRTTIHPSSIIHLNTCFTDHNTSAKTYFNASAQHCEIQTEEESPLVGSHVRLRRCAVLDFHQKSESEVRDCSIQISNVLKQIQASNAITTMRNCEHGLFSFHSLKKSMNIHRFPKEIGEHILHIVHI